MAAFFSCPVKDFLNTDPELVVGRLADHLIQIAPKTYAESSISWKEQTRALRDSLKGVCADNPHAGGWGLLLELPLLRLQRRLDIVLLAGRRIVVVEYKYNASEYTGADKRQTEDYALDLRDFHSGSANRPILPVLWASKAPTVPTPTLQDDPGVGPLALLNDSTLQKFLSQLASGSEPASQIELRDWEGAAYCPVPPIVQAAELIFAGHKVEEIAHSSAGPDRIAAALDALYEIAKRAKENREFIVAVVTGVPGSGKTLVGLTVAHSSAFKGLGASGVFLSGNRPLVHVLREALARDHSLRLECKLGESRRTVRTEIQSLMDYLRHYVTAHPDAAPHESVIVFDEAQRAWDERTGQKKFGRTASEPQLFLDIKSRKKDWGVIVALVGGGQEINSGEKGLQEWGAAIRRFNSNQPKRWQVAATRDALEGGPSTEGERLAWNLATEIPASVDPRLHLDISFRSIRSKDISHWVDAALAGNAPKARTIAASIERFPIHLTRSVDELRRWLRNSIRGTRRCGLVASSGAKRLRAYGLPPTLSSEDLSEIAAWYLLPDGDIRSSYQLEVPVSEYTSQGLELDFTGVCWGGDMLWDQGTARWVYRSLRGNKWILMRGIEDRRHISNTYRVLLTRARLEMCLWVPSGDNKDSTRPAGPFDATALFLESAGARTLP